jgi:creatinine amidohydrolase
VPFAVEIFADHELVSDKFQGDHAGKFELSQLLAIHPELVDLSRLNRGREAGAGGRLAIGDDAAEATAEHGRIILEQQLSALGEVVRNWLATPLATPPSRRLSLADAEQIWTEIVRNPAPFVTTQPAATQVPVSMTSRWKSGEHFAVS